MPQALSSAFLSLEVLVAVAGCSSSKAEPRYARADSRSAVSPVVVELFQSQGCSSCPPANAELNAIADRSDVIALSFAVTYWDRLGWKDTFGSPSFTARQQNYADAGRGEVATPEFIVNGTDAVVGSNRQALDAAIAKPLRPSGVSIVFAGPSRVRVEARAGGVPAVVWRVRFDPRTLEVPIRAGENGGRTLPHRNVVRELVQLGDWSVAQDSFLLPPSRETGLAAAILVQRGSGGPIIAARKL